MLSHTPENPREARIFRQWGVQGDSIPLPEGFGEAEPPHPLGLQSCLGSITLPVPFGLPAALA